jgi:hypothetical protein
VTAAEIGASLDPALKQRHAARSLTGGAHLGSGMLVR